MIDRTSAMIKGVGDYALATYSIIPNPNIDEAVSNYTAAIESIDKKVTLFPNTAVLVIDMQEECLKYVAERNDIEEAQIEILRYCAEYDIPVIEIEISPQNVVLTSRTIEKIKKEIEHCRIKVELEKQTPSAFFQTNLKEILDKLGVRNLFLMGVYAYECVYSTARDALFYGFNISSSERVISSEIIHHESIFKVLDCKTGELTNISSIYNWYKENCTFFGNDLSEFFLRMKNNNNYGIKEDRKGEQLS